MIAQGGYCCHQYLSSSAQESSHERKRFEMPLGNLGCLKMSAHKRPMDSPMAYKFPQWSAYQHFSISKHTQEIIIFPGVNRSKFGSSYIRHGDKIIISLYKAKY